MPNESTIPASPTAMAVCAQRGCCAVATEHSEYCPPHRDAHVRAAWVTKHDCANPPSRLRSRRLPENWLRPELREAFEREITTGVRILEEIDAGQTTNPTDTPEEALLRRKFVVDLIREEIADGLTAHPRDTTEDTELRRTLVAELAEVQVAEIAYADDTNDIPF